MNQKDIKILTNLRKDARMSLTKMSKITAIPVSTIFDKLKMFENNLVIRHTALINFNELGYYTRVNMTIKIARDDREKAKEYLMKSEFVNTVFKINNGYDFMIEGIFKNLLEMEQFIECLEDKFKVENHKSHFIIEDIKRECFMTNII